MDKQNHTTKRVGRIEITQIENGKFVRKPVYLGSRVTGEGIGRVVKYGLVDKPTDWTVDEFVNMTALLKLLPRWSKGENHFNDATVFHEDTLTLVELNQYERVIGTVDSDIEAA